jgi:hypothetical protein
MFEGIYENIQRGDYIYTIDYENGVYKRVDIIRKSLPSYGFIKYIDDGTKKYFEINAEIKGSKEPAQYLRNIGVIGEHERAKLVKILYEAKDKYVVMNIDDFRARKFIEWIKKNVFSGDVEVEIVKSQESQIREEPVKIDYDKIYREVYGFADKLVNYFRKYYIMSLGLETIRDMIYDIALRYIEYIKFGIKKYDKEDMKVYMFRTAKAQLGDLAKERERHIPSEEYQEFRDI